MCWSQKNVCRIFKRDYLISLSARNLSKSLWNSLSCMIRYFSNSVSAWSFACSALILPGPISSSRPLNSRKPSRRVAQECKYREEPVCLDWWHVRLLADDYVWCGRGWSHCFIISGAVKHWECWKCSLEEKKIICKAKITGSSLPLRWKMGLLVIRTLREVQSSYFNGRLSCKKQ